jgi:hypothetical protein
MAISNKLKDLGPLNHVRTGRVLEGFWKGSRSSPEGLERKSQKGYIKTMTQCKACNKALTSEERRDDHIYANRCKKCMISYKAKRMHNLGRSLESIAQSLKIDVDQVREAITKTGPSHLKKINTKAMVVAREVSNNAMQETLLRLGLISVTDIEGDSR